MPAVRTRFAPSPTGYMHIGGMRTAFFNWLWARHNDGQFILRIDDTDQFRNLEEALEPILEAFRWLGLDWDEGPEVGGPHVPYFQSQRGDLYREAVDRLLADGKAYRDFDSPEQIQADRDEAQRQKRDYLNIRRSLELSPEDIDARMADGVPHVIRLLVPRDRKVAIDDVVRGRVEWDCSRIADPVLVRGNGTPLYNFATVVDDALMNITHVLRGEEHLTNTAVQILIYEALGQSPPVFAHIPFITAPGTNKKLSKRDLNRYRNNPQFRKMFQRGDDVFPQLGLEPSERLTPVMVAYYEQIGYLPEAVRNALARLGWSLDDKTEILSLQDVVSNFTLERIVKSPAGLDPDKLNSYQLHWMNQLSVEAKVEGVLPFLQQAGLVGSLITDEQRERITEVVTALGERLKVFADILDVAYFFKEPIEYDEKAFQKRIAKEGVPELLREYSERIAELPQWTLENLEETLQQLAAERDVSPGLLIHALRISTTGQPTGPGVYECVLLVGRKRALARISAALAKLDSD